MLRRRRDICRRPRALFEATRVRVGFNQHGTALPVSNFETIEAARSRFCHDPLPDPGGAQTVHAVYAPLPGVEITDYRDLRGIRRPYAKHGSPGTGLSAKQLIGLDVASFVEKI